MKRFVFSRYEIRSEKIADPVKICFLTDWHASAKSYTPAALMNLLECEEPDLLLIGGDIVSCTVPESMRIADSFLKKAAAIFPGGSFFISCIFCEGTRSTGRTRRR